MFSETTVLHFQHTDSHQYSVTLLLQIGFADWAFLVRGKASRSKAARGMAMRACRSCFN